MEMLSDEELEKMTEGERLDYWLKLLEYQKQQNTELAEDLDEAIGSGLVDRVKKILDQFFEQWPAMVWDSFWMILRAFGLPV